MTIKIKDVATLAGVSPKTVSRVLNGEPHVRDDKREAVLKAVAELDYRPNVFARSLSSTRSYLLGLLIDDPSSGYAAGIQMGAMMRCRQKSYHLIVEPIDLSAPTWRDSLASTMDQLKLDGAIVTPPLCDESLVLDMLDAAMVPFVRISPASAPERSAFVRMDDHAAAHEMINHLMKAGHRKIGFIRGDLHHSASQRRYDGYCAAMEENGLQIDSRWIASGDFSFRSGVEAAEAILGHKERPTAIFASNDDMALGVLMTALRRQIPVPESLSVAGFDDAPMARAVWPQLTTIRQPEEEMAAAAVDILVDPANRAKSPVAEDRLLPYQLVIRGSTAPPENFRSRRTN